MKMKLPQLIKMALYRNDLHEHVIVICKAH
ncbi:hypothetical protein QE407_004835 [Pantoea dispersa]|nr:hypothetical protein [Pantoea dispersa]